MIHGRNVSDQLINSMTKTYENIRKLATGQGYDYTISCLLDYSYFKENYKMIALDLTKLQGHQMLIQEQFKKSFLQQIQMEQEIQQCSLLLKKQKKLFRTFHKEL